MYPKLFRKFMTRKWHHNGWKNEDYHHSGHHKHEQHGSDVHTVAETLVDLRDELQALNKTLATEHETPQRVTIPVTQGDEHDQTPDNESTENEELREAVAQLREDLDAIEKRLDDT